MYCLRLGSQLILRYLQRQERFRSGAGGRVERVVRRARNPRGGVLLVQQALTDGNGTEATRLWDVMEKAVENATDNVDFYNLLLHNLDDDVAGGGVGGVRASASWWLANAPGASSHPRLLARSLAPSRVV